MKCPFLRDASVKYCEASAYRKMILKAGGDAVAERCSSPAWVECRAAASRLFDTVAQDHCPFLHEAHAEFCGAAPLVKYIPATNDLLSHCNSDGHLYCELYLALADPQGERRPHSLPSGDVAQIPRVNGMPVPPHLSYAPNHMWLDVADDGIVHIGLDAFAARVIGTIDRISFLTAPRPVAVLSVNGVDLQLMFPNPLRVTAANVYLRTNPEKVIEDPYGAGWLFEGTAGVDGSQIGEGLLDGTQAVEWFGKESVRLDQFVHLCAALPDGEGNAFMNDGGSVVEGVSRHLDREDLLALINDFFSMQQTWRGTW
jgi:glycine cleavage system H lipoate-binding protein